MKINVLGSCVSRVSLLDGDTTGHGVAEDEMEWGITFINRILYAV